MKQVLEGKFNDMVQEVLEIKRLVSGKSLNHSSHERQHDKVSAHTLILYVTIRCANLFTWTEFHNLLNIL